jgi:hypothetical protein
MGGAAGGSSLKRTDAPARACCRPDMTYVCLEHENHGFLVLFQAFGPILLVLVPYVGELEPKHNDYMFSSQCIKSLRYTCMILNDIKTRMLPFGWEKNAKTAKDLWCGAYFHRKN